MESSIVLVIVVLAVSFIGSMMKKAQSMQEANKKKETAATNVQREQNLREVRQKKVETRAFGETMSAFGNQSEPQETMRPFGGEASQTSNPSMQPQQMSTLFGDDKAHTRRVVRSETIDERDADERARMDANSNQIELHFDKDSLLQSIILAEALKRPKPGSFKRLPANR